MTDFLLRSTAEGDLEQIIRIWSASFGDSEEFIRSLVEECSLIEKGVCAEADGKARAFMFAFDGLSFEGKEASYIFALCTQSEYRRRGFGRALALYATKQAKERGSDFVFLRPADKELADWYSSAIGALPFASTANKKFTASLPAKLKATEISADEYFKARSRSPWRVPEEMLLAESIIHRYYGGAFLRCGDSFICAEKSADALYLREIIGEDTALAASAAAEYFTAKDIYLPCPSADGIPLMVIPPFSQENISAIPLMPFTFD